MTIKNIKTVLILLLFFTILPAQLLFAQSNSITRAVELVEEFRAEAGKRLDNAIDSEKFMRKVKKYKKESFEYWKSTKEEFKTLSWSDRPGARRARAVHSKVETYISKEIETITRLAAELSASEKKSIERAVKRFKYIKEKILTELDEVAKKEVIKKERRKAVPLIDQSPLEKGPEEEGGDIWVR